MFESDSKMENPLFSLSPAFSPAQTLAPLSFSFGPISFSFLFSLRIPKPRRRPMSPFLAAPFSSSSHPLPRGPRPSGASSTSSRTLARAHSPPVRASPRLAWPARVAAPPDINRLKCANHHQNDNQGHHALKTDQSGSAVG